MALPSIATPGDFPLTGDRAIIQGSAYSLTVVLTDSATGDALDLTGVTGEAMVRATFSDAAPIASLTVTVDQLNAGTLTLAADADTTSAIVGPGGIRRVVPLGFWDLAIIEGTDRVRVLQGIVELSQEATKV